MSPESDEENNSAAPPATDKPGSVGTGGYVVQAGDCISSIAKTAGHFWETIWNHPDNATLKQARRDPNVLLPGDRLTVPPIRVKEESHPTDAHHRFQRKGEPSKLRLRFLEERYDEQPEKDAPPPRYERRDVITEDPPPPDEPVKDRPRANVPYVLDIDGKLTQGSTDGDGYVSLFIPGNARHGRLTLSPGTPEETAFDLQLGHLDPIDQIIGVKQRLVNLAFDCGDRSNEMTPGFRDALAAFQEKYGLQVTGDLTDDVRNKLRELHGS